VGGNSPIPKPVASDGRFRAVSVGAAHACAITVQNILYCWGLAVRGRSQDDPSFGRSVPERF
jgi:Regulator of Chromosome Condensation (RCC1) repeat protein